MKVNNEQSERTPPPGRSKLDMRVRRIKLKGSRVREEVESDS